jgi:phage terminase large subunit-like protein
MTTCKLNPYIEKWLAIVEKNKYETCLDQKLLAKYVRKCFAEEDIYTDDQQLEKYLGLAKYFPFQRLFPWEEFCIALHLTTFWSKSGMPRWPDLFLLIGRGAGKDAYIAVESLCVISPYSNLPQYDVDICANVEEQAMRPVKDLLEIMDDNRFRQKMKRFFYWTKEQIKGLKTKAIIKGRTKNPESKDGMRSGMVVFNEIHQYQNYKNIKVFITGLGKKKHPRRLYATTNGDVREGPLDELLARSEEILKGEADDNGLLPFICRLDSKKEADNEKMWVKANPSLPYRPDLMTLIKKEYIDWKKNPIANGDFMTKRMNLPQSASEMPVTEWDNIFATYKKDDEIRTVPDLTAWPCVVGIDYTKVTDWMSVNLHFRDGDIRYDINHSWLCLASRDLHRLKVPWREWEEAGHLTVVDDVEISPDIPAEYIFQQAQKYDIKKIAMDNFRYALLTNSLKSIGFEAKEKKVKLIRQSDIMIIHPVIEHCFAKQYFIWGDNPPFRWATNNTKSVPANRNIRNAAGVTNADLGNFIYGKIEPKSRKTDPFMALVASMIIESELPERKEEVTALPVITA